MIPLDRKTDMCVRSRNSSPIVRATAVADKEKAGELAMAAARRSVRSTSQVSTRNRIRPSSPAS